MNDFDKNMEQIFDVMPVEVLPKQKLPAVVEVKDADYKEDLSDAYEQSKDNLQELLDNGKEAMDELLQIAKAGQHPRAFEVYSGLLKNLVDANKELLATQKQMREMDENAKKSTSSGPNIDKAIFVGSTSELSKLLKGKT